MKLRKLSLIIFPAIILMSAGAFAGDGHSPRPPQDYDQGYDQPRPDYGYDEGCYGYGCGGPQLPPPCCQVAPPPCCVVVGPPPLPPPVYFNPGINYYCGVNCAPPVLPYPQPIAPYPIRPGYGFRGGPGWAATPGNNRPFPYGGRPYGRISLAGCELQQGNNGEFSVISSGGETVFRSKARHAQENAEYMKSYYEKNSTLCGGVPAPAKALDI